MTSETSSVRWAHNSTAYCWGFATSFLCKDTACTVPMLQYMLAYTDTCCCLLQGAAIHVSVCGGCWLKPRTLLWL
jgi:hypothetical protein